MKVYLAWKINQNGRRHKIVPSLRESSWWDIVNFDWYEYVWPHFIGCDHWCFHWDNSHGCWADEDKECGDSSITMLGVFQKCTTGITECDVFFARIDEHDAYGTISEIGYAYNQKKQIIIAFKKGLKVKQDLRFVEQFSNISFEAKTAEEAREVAQQKIVK